jgi:BTB/POZ domain
MDVLLNAVDMITGRAPAPSTQPLTGNDGKYNESQSANPSTDVESDQISLDMAKDSSYHTQTISVASSEPSDDDDETATTASYPPCTVSMNGDDRRINWRNDPKQSFSDCTIEVVLKSTHDTLPHVFTRPSGNPNVPVPNSKVRTYHVHRSVLAYGQRRSLYFVKLFQKNYVQSNDDTDEEELYRKCRIYLSKDVAKVFPALLDYLYTMDDEASNVITSDNIIQLHFLSKILQITCLRSDTEKFYEKDMSIGNCYRYYTQAHALNGQKIMKAVTTLVINNLSKIKLQSDLLTDFRALSLWKHVVQSKYRSNTVNESIQISTLVACFCKLHRKLLQKDDFIRLTDVRYMPVIHYQVALPLLEISKELRTTESTGTLNRLQTRCLDAFVQSWKIWMTSPNFQQALSKLDVFELYYLLNSALNNSEEKAPLIQSIRKHQATMNQKKEPPTSAPKSRSATPSAPPVKSTTAQRASVPTPPVPCAAAPPAPSTQHRAPPPPPKAPTMAPRAMPPPQALPMQRLAQQPQTVTVMPVPSSQLHGPPHHMNMVAVNAHPPMMMNGQTVLVNPLQYQQILQHREMCWNDYRNMKRKQMGDAAANDSQQQMAVAHATAMHQQQQQQQFVKRFRPNSVPFHPPFPPNQQPHFPPPAAPWYGWVQK